MAGEENIERRLQGIWRMACELDVELTCLTTWSVIGRCSSRRCSRASRSTGNGGDTTSAN